MGCAQSSGGGGEEGSSDGPRDGERQGRQRSAMRRPGSSRRRYQTGSDAGSSSRNAALTDAHDSMLNSDVGASNLIMSQRSSFRSFNFSSPRQNGGAMTPRSTGVGGRPPIPPAARVMDRRMSVGRFADEPSEPEFRARLAAAIAKAKTIHGIDGSVDLPDERALRQGAKAGEVLLGSIGMQRIAAWVEDVQECAAVDNASISPSASTPQAWDHRLSVDDLAGTPADTTPLPNAVDLGPETSPATGQIQLLTPPAVGSSRVEGEDDASSMIFLSGKAGPQRMKVTADNLKENHEKVVNDSADMANVFLYVTRPRRRTSRLSAN